MKHETEVLLIELLRSFVRTGGKNTGVLTDDTARMERAYSLLREYDAEDGGTGDEQGTTQKSG